MSGHDVIGSDFNLTDVGDGLAKPGMDTRQWVSYGIVEAMTAGQGEQVIDFTPELGPLVQVTLQPSGISLSCRVGCRIAGNNESEYYPFVAGDEVLVVIPEGDERSGAVIIARLNQELDLWPGTVAGQDSTANTFGFTRMKAPYIVEFAASYMMRSAGTKAYMSFTQNGNVAIQDGNSSFLTFTPDAVTFGSGDGNEMIQFDLHQNLLVLQGGTTTGSIFTIGDTSNFFSAGTLALNLAGIPALENAASIQGVMNVLSQFLPQLWALIGPALSAIPAAPTFPGGAPFAAALTPIFTVPATIAAIIQATMPLAAVSSITLFADAIAQAVAVKPGDPSGNFPGVGSPGIIIG